MSFALKISRIPVALVVLCIMLHPSCSFVPSSVTSQKSINDSNHGPFLVPSQVRRRRRCAVTSPSSSPVDPPPLQLIPSQVIRSSNRKKPKQSQRKMIESHNDTAFASTFSSPALVSSTLSTDGSSKQKQRKRRRTRKRKHMKKDSGSKRKDRRHRQRRVLMGNLPDIHWYVHVGFLFILIAASHPHSYYSIIQESSPNGSLALTSIIH